MTTNILDWDLDAAVEEDTRRWASEAAATPPHQSGIFGSEPENSCMQESSR